ncbi:MAG TPA: aldehyde dehydrogenase family protein [Thermoanaerobaculia bacterium]|nr:aldehyde dehydrogenase family protein [Thermoanaerobaculia bacterium]
MINIAASSISDVKAGSLDLRRSGEIARRSRLVLRLAALMELAGEAYASLMTDEMGKTIRGSRAEIAKSAATARYFAGAAPGMLASETIPSHGGAFRIRYEPLGTVLGVMPWNFPFWQVLRFAIPALLAGNRVVVKHSSRVPRCAAALDELFREAGFSEDLISVESGPHHLVAKHIQNDHVRAVVFTGGRAAGSEVATLAGRHIKKVVLELGGSDAFIVLPSADLDRAVTEGVRSRIHCNGQACTAAKRFIVHESIASAFTSRFVSAMASLRAGDPFDDRTDLGPLAGEDVAVRLEAQVAASIDAGARLLTGGHRLGGTLYAPTVLAGMPFDAPAAQEETFGPVAAILRAKDVDEAVAIANATPFGLGASIWTADATEAERCIEELETGQVFVNGIVSSDPRVPFGGVKGSGYGRELGIHGIRELTNIKCVWIAD